jgi:hypothetical protein
MHRRNFLLLVRRGLKPLVRFQFRFLEQEGSGGLDGRGERPAHQQIAVGQGNYGFELALWQHGARNAVPRVSGMGGPRGSAGQSYKGVIRWESALPVRDALKEPLPEGFENMYVISVGGIPLNAGSRSQSSSQYPSRYPSQYPPQQQQDDSPESDQKLLDRMRGATLLEPKDKRYLQPALVVQQPAGYGNVYFGFAKDIVTLRLEDREVGFTTQFGQIQVKTKFYLKDMLYRGELAV